MHVFFEETELMIYLENNEHILWNYAATSSREMRQAQVMLASKFKEIKLALTAVEITNHST